MDKLPQMRPAPPYKDMPWYAFDLSPTLTEPRSTALLCAYMTGGAFRTVAPLPAPTKRAVQFLIDYRLVFEAAPHALTDRGFFAVGVTAQRDEFDHLTRPLGITYGTWYARKLQLDAEIQRLKDEHYARGAAGNDTLAPFVIPTDDAADDTKQKQAAAG